MGGVFRVSWHGLWRAQRASLRSDGENDPSDGCLLKLPFGDVAAAQDRRFSLLGLCGPNGALSVGGDGKDEGLWAARGSPSGRDGSPEVSFASRLDLREALNGRLLQDGPCSRIFVGFPGGQSWRFQVNLDNDGRVAKVGPTEIWQ